MIYDKRETLIKVGPNEGRNAILNMYRLPGSLKYYGVIRYNGFAYSFMASERIARATVYGFKGTLEELDRISKAIQARMRPNREPVVLTGHPDSPVYEKRYFYNYLSKGLLIYKAPGLTKNGEEKYLGYVTSHAFVAYKKGLEVVILYKNIRFIFSTNKYNRKPSSGTDADKLREVVLSLIYNVDKQLKNDEIIRQQHQQPKYQYKATSKQQPAKQQVKSDTVIVEGRCDNVEFDASDF